MNDLISRSALIEWTYQSLDDNPHALPKDRVMHKHEHECFLVMLDKAPAVDAVPVVRCGECIKPIEECPFKDHVMLKTDYCSYGERRNGDG
jgi:hypothetical protein